MSAHDQMRAMLDELMGTTRDGESSLLQIDGIFSMGVKLIKKKGLFLK